MKNNLISLLLILLITGFHSCSDDASNCCDPVQQKPNVLLIIADDFGKDACINYSEGSVKPNMPNLQAIANNGIQFENFWVNPLCTPTRASILTGKYPLRTDMLEVGNVLDQNETSIFEYIQQENANAYSSALIGKWHLGRGLNHPSNLGVPFYSGLISGAVQSYTDWTWTHDGMSENSSEYTTTKFTDLAIDWIQDQDQPWFLWLAYNAPHTPFHLPPSNLHSQSGLSGEQSDISARPLPYFMAMIEAMDSEIGRLLASMTQAERDNTYIIFIGDNGSPQTVAQAPYDNTKSKNSLFLGGVNTPMFISGPGINGPAINTENFIQSTDLFTTIAQICGSQSTSINDSKSFYGLLEGQTTESREYLYSEIGGTSLAGHAIRNLDYLLINYDNNSSLMFDLKLDPDQNSDLLQSPLSTEAQSSKSALELELQSIRN